MPSLSPPAAPGGPSPLPSPNPQDSILAATGDSSGEDLDPEFHGLSSEPPPAQTEPDKESPATGRGWLGPLSSLAARLYPARSRQPSIASDTNPAPAARPEDIAIVGPGQLPNAADFNPLPSQAEESPKSSDEIFAEIGVRLRNRREALSLTYQEVERHIKVRAAFLEALESGTLDGLPSPVQTRGILANYAAFLDLDADAIMLRFADGLQARHRELGSQKRSGHARARMTVNTRLPPLRSFIVSDLLFGGGVAIMLLLFAMWGISRIIAVNASTSAKATSPSISDVLGGNVLPTVAQQVTLIPAQATSLASGLALGSTSDLPTLAANMTVQINLAATGRTYMRISVDGKVQFEGRSEPGSNYSYQAAHQIEVLVGDAAALKVEYNGRDLGLMGGFGEVLDRIYTAEGVATPTGTLRPTRTPTPNITATPSLTPTRTPSSTPTPKPGG